MQLTSNIRRMCVLAGITVMAAIASAAEIPLDAQIMIDRALNSPTVTIRYNGANAAVVEFRLNGESIGTRSVNASKASGETNFNIDLGLLKDGDNEVEIRLFDRTGKLVGSDKTNISTDQSNRGPVFLKTPKVGQTVQGAVEINLGFGKDLKNIYVSFFVDNDFKKMSNYPPYNFIWDTSMETNGWHEVEAWVIDETSTTFKTRKTRVFVNNPGGHTARVGVNTEPVPSKNPIKGEATGQEVGPKALVVKSSGQAAGANTSSKAPAVSGSVSPNRVRANSTGSMSGTKSISNGVVLATGVKSITPSSTKKPAEIKTEVQTPITAVKTSGVAAKTTGDVSVKTSEPKLHPQTAATSKAILPKPVQTVARAETKPVQTVVKAELKPVQSAAKVQPKTSTDPKLVALKVPTTQGATLSHVKAASNTVAVTKGQRFPNLGTFAVVLNSQFVNFDVNPRVDEGVPMTPFRHLLEKAGGTVDWENLSKTMKARAEGKDIIVQIGELEAKVDMLSVTMERAPYLERGRTIVPLSFLRDVLSVNIEFDKETGHVLITSLKK